MNKIPTAKEFYDNHYSDDCVIIMRDYAKLHVEAALKEASENFKMKIRDNIKDLHMNDEWTEVDKDSILNAYPLTLIK